MTVKQTYCKDDPTFAILVIGTFNVMARSGSIQVPPEPIPTTKTVPRTELTGRLQILERLPREQIYPWITFPINVICRAVRSALRRIGHILN